ncbi:Domain of unknown function DUF1724 [Methanosalsum zhilinae DSM 4017]|uniref:Uncharacterized protein n=2 Tax=Methanosalsum zhilinae TaxID=39669 RepID=F7XND1_METZD|nr:Domain of unknown function DUF1724 [Methanosalsum zhilinae DSM 4017]
MMKKSLIDVLFMSEKRKKVLLLLIEEPKEMKHLLKSINTTRQALLPQMRLLEEHHLIVQCNGKYELTTVGNLIVNEMIPLLNTIEVFDNNIDYWGTRNLKIIPKRFLKRTSELKGCKMIEPSLVDIFEANKDFIKNAQKSSSLYFIFTFMHPSLLPLAIQLVNNDIDISVIINKDMLQKIESELSNEFNQLIKTGKIKFYLYQEEIGILSLALSDDYLVLRLFSKTYFGNNKFSNEHVFCSTSQAHQWGEDLFSYYLKNSTLIAEI